jgi:tetratricopeptide (TPR) repeat protein
MNGFGLQRFLHNYHYRPLTWIRDVNFSTYESQIKILRNEAEYNYKKGYQKKDIIVEMAVLDIVSGDYKAAKSKLLANVDTDANRYNVLANLGVVYEVMGNDDSAKYYVAKALKLNPSSHEGSEWIHLKLLQAKGMGDDWIYKNDIASYEIIRNGTNVMNAKTPAGTFKLYKFIQQLSFQLHERMLFVKPKDKIVANLLFTLGKLYYEDRQIKKAQEAFRLAVEYDPALRERSAFYLETNAMIFEMFSSKILAAREASKAAAEINAEKQMALKAALRHREYTKIDSELATGVWKEKRNLQIFIAASGLLLTIMLLLIFLRRRKKS